MSTTPSPWLPAFTVNAGNTFGTQSEPDIVGLSNGNFLVTWTDAANNVDSANGTDIIGQIFNPLGTAVGGPFVVNNFSVDNERSASIDALPGGGFVVVYVDDESSPAIRFRMFDSEANAVNSGTIYQMLDFHNDLRGPSVVALEDGSFTVSYRDFNTIPGALFGSQLSFVSYDSQGTPIPGEGAVFIGAERFESEVARLTNGQTVMVYEETSFGNRNVKFEIGTTFAISEGAGVLDDDSNAQFDPQIAGLTTGGFVAVWVDDGGANNDIVFERRSATGALLGGNDIRITSDAENNNEPDVIGLADGGFFVVWDDDTNGRLEGQRFDAGGIAVGSQVLIATGAVSEPELSLTSDGRILVAWRSSGDIRSIILDPRGTTIDGTADADVLTSLTTSSTVNGLGGNDTIFGLDGDDRLNGGSGNDSINGGAGNDTLEGGSGGDTLNGGEGNDTALYNNAARGVIVRLDAGNGSGSEASLDRLISIENVQGSDHSDTLIGNDGNNVLAGRSGNDLLRGLGGDDSITGDFGDDTVSGGEGIDTLSGGSGGNDTLDLSEEGNAFGITANLSLGTFTYFVPGQFFGIIATETATGFENIIGSSKDDLLIGDFQSNRLEGRDGNDRFEGGGGADSYDGGAGSDTVRFNDSEGWTVDLTAGIAANTAATTIESLISIENIIGSSANDKIVGTTGSNFLDGGDGDDILVGRGGVDDFRGGLGTDTVDLRGSSSRWRIDLGDDSAVITTASGREHTVEFSDIEFVIGTRNAMTVIGTTANERVIGLSSSDTFFVGGGIDHFDGGLGSDTISFGSHLEGLTVRGSAGTARTSDGTTVTTFTGVENLLGTSFADDMTGTFGNNKMEGRAGDDILNAGSGNDTVRGGAGNDTLIGGRGDDVIDGGDDVDEARFNGARADFEITRSGAVTTVTFIGSGTDEGTDTLTNVEFLVFNDTTLDVLLI